MANPLEGFSERYERDVIDKLRVCEKDGKGQLRQLCTVEIDGRQLPFVSFTTGEQVIVTARHHIHEFWGPTEAVMRLVESGQEGFTLVPVVDVEYYAESEARKELILSFPGREPSACMYDMFGGYKEGPPSNAKNQWQDYRYDSDDSPPHIAAIKRLIDTCRLFVDLHNSNLNAFFFYTTPTEINGEVELMQSLAGEIEGRGQRIRYEPRYSPSLEAGAYYLARGVYRHTGSNCSIGYAAKIGKLNFAFEIPVFDYRSATPGKWDLLSDVEEMADVTTGTISTLARQISAKS